MKPVAIVLMLIASVASGQEPRNADWVAKDLRGMEQLLSLIPIETKGLDDLKRKLGRVRLHDRGFGASTFAVGEGHGYASVFIEGLVWNGQIGRYKAGFSGKSAEVLNAWRAAAGPPLRCDDYSCVFEGQVPGPVQRYKDAVAAALGPLKPVEVPKGMADAYAYLLSPHEVTYVGPGICGLGGPVLEGRQAIDTLMTVPRLDLLTNILRGYNPGGRIYAVLALQELRGKGYRISAETDASIRKVLRLPVEISTCQGCIVTGGLSARDAVNQLRER